MDLNNLNDQIGKLVQFGDTPYYCAGKVPNGLALCPVEIVTGENLKYVTTYPPPPKPACPPDAEKMQQALESILYLITSYACGRCNLAHFVVETKKLCQDALQPECPKCECSECKKVGKKVSSTSSLN